MFSFWVLSERLFALFSRFRLQKPHIFTKSASYISASYVFKPASYADSTVEVFNQNSSRFRPSQTGDVWVVCDHGGQSKKLMSLCFRTGFVVTVLLRVHAHIFVDISARHGAFVYMMWSWSIMMWFSLIFLRDMEHLCTWCDHDRSWCDHDVIMIWSWCDLVEILVRFYVEIMLQC